MIPETDRSSLTSLTSFISNRIIQELSPLTEGGTPLGYLTGLITENRRACPLVAWRRILFGDS
jgi:hypothetical protein